MRGAGKKSGGNLILVEDKVGVNIEGTETLLEISHRTVRTLAIQRR